MGVSMGSTGNSNVSEINMTPMIDVLLVLLVIFIIAQPMLQKTLDMQVPKKEKATANNAPLIILQVMGSNEFALNQKPLNRENLEAELRKVYSGRDDDLLFVKPELDVTFGDVTWAMDRAKGAGVKVIGTVLNDPADGG